MSGTRKRRIKQAEIDQELYTYKKTRLNTFYRTLIGTYEFNLYMENFASNDKNIYTVPRYVHFMIEKLIDPKKKVNELVTEHLSKINDDDEDPDDLIEDVADDFDVVFAQMNKYDTTTYQNDQIANTADVGGIDVPIMIHYIIYFYTKIVTYSEATKETDLIELHKTYNPDELSRLRELFKNHTSAASEAERRKNNRKQILDESDNKHKQELLTVIHTENEKLKIENPHTNAKLVEQEKIFYRYIEEFNKLYYYYDKIMKTNIQLPGDNYPPYDIYTDDI
jgi:hypothetical protein